MLHSVKSYSDVEIMPKVACVKRNTFLPANQHKQMQPPFRRRLIDIESNDEARVLEKVKTIFYFFWSFTKNG